MPRTREEFEARRRWDTSLMTDEEKEAHMQHILSMYGAITDETFDCADDMIPAVAVL